MDVLEKTILAEFLKLKDYDQQIEILLNLGSKHFKDEESKLYLEIFSKCLFEKRKVVDQISIYEDVLKTPGADPVIFASLVNYGYENRIVDHIEQLKERTYRNEIINVIDKTNSEIKNAISNNDFEQIKDELIINLNSINKEDVSSFVDFGKNIELLETNINKSFDIEGKSWGIKDLDTYTSGIMSPRLYVLGGLKKTGKSRFIINEMIVQHNNNIPTVFLSLEMPEYEITKLLISRYTDIPEIRLRSASFLKKEDFIKFKMSKTEINWDLLNVECANRLNVAQVISRIRKYKKMFGNPIIFIDYLQRISHDRNKQAQELESISIAIADATREYDLSIILLSQLSNLAEREGASIGSLKGSGGIGETADVILLLSNLYRKSKSKLDEGKFEIIIEQRYGDSGLIKCSADLGTCHFADNVFVQEQYDTKNSNNRAEEEFDLCSKDYLDKNSSNKF